MGWLKIDDKMPRNPKILAGDLETAWYFTCALAHCAEQLTDGFIASTAVPLIAPHITSPRDVAERCVSLGMLQEVDEGYLVPDYCDYNPSRADVMEKRVKDAERQRKVRGASQRDSQRDSQPVSQGESRSESTRPVPSRPVPSSVVVNKSSNGLEVSRETEELATTWVNNHVAHKRGDIRNVGAFKRSLKPKVLDVIVRASALGHDPRFDLFEEWPVAEEHRWPGKPPDNDWDQPAQTAVTALHEKLAAYPKEAS